MGKRSEVVLGKKGKPDKQSKVEESESVIGECKIHKAKKQIGKRLKRMVLGKKETSDKQSKAEKERGSIIGECKIDTAKKQIGMR